MTLNPDWLESAVFLICEKADNSDGGDVAMYRYGVKIFLMKPLQVNSYAVSTDFLTYIFIITKCISESFHGLKSGQIREADYGT